MKEQIQRFGGFMAGMIIPNIGAFIAWGLITALFIPTGWVPNERFSELVGPMILNLLPILIGYTGGKMIHGTRGGVIGAVATMGVIVGGGYLDLDTGEFKQIPMFLGGMVMGPLAGWLLKKVDEALEDHVPVGFEMLINNFTSGILGMLLAMLGLVAVSPIVIAISGFFGGVLDSLVSNGLLPLAALVIEPAKVLFMNNALNHGVLGPLGAEAVAAGVASGLEEGESAKAIHFLLETNPGPGLGLLTAYWVAGKGLMKQSAPGAAIIHFLGGIHEIYFPYVLARPLMILSVIAGGMAADGWFAATDAGLVATPSPGSIFAYFAVLPKGEFFPVMGGVVIGAVVSAIVGILILKVRPIMDDTSEKTSTDVYDGSGGIPGLSGD